MLYLAWQHLWFLVGAAGCGLVIGWLTATDANRPARSRWFTLAIALWLLALVASLIRLVNGRPALLLETALIYLAIYAAGCMLGGLARRAMATPVAALPAPEPLLALPPPAPAVAEAVSEAEVIAQAQDDTVALPRADLPAELAMAAAPEREQALPGERPPALAGARESVPDDLKRIKGIGPGNEERLRGIGIWHLDQIAAWSPGEVAWVGGYLAFPGRIEREDWVGQAGRLIGAATEAGVTSAAETAADRPRNALDAPRDDAPDRLTLLAGIGPGLADRLNRQGLWHYNQIAALHERELADLLAGLGGDATISARLREDADILAHGGETAHSRAVKSGRVTPRD